MWKKLVGIAITPMGWTGLLEIGRSMPRTICSAKVFGNKILVSNTDDNSEADTDDNTNGNTNDDKDDNTDDDADNGTSRPLG